MTAQYDRFTAEQVDAPDGVVHVADECEPGWAIGSAVAWPVVLREHAAYDVFVYVEAKGVGNLLGDLQIAELGITPFQLDNCRNEFGRRTLGTGFAWSTRGREEYAGATRSR